MPLASFSTRNSLSEYRALLRRAPGPCRTGRSPAKWWTKASSLNSAKPLWWTDFQEGVANRHEGFCRKNHRDHRRRHHAQALQRRDVRRLGGGDGGNQTAAARIERLPKGLRVTTHVADVSIEDQLKRFRDDLIEQQATDRINLLFNNAGIGGGGSLFTNSRREQRERTFNTGGGIYLGVRTFLPLLLKADEGHIVNTSSVNGFWASVGLGCRIPPTAPRNSR